MLPCPQVSCHTPILFDAAIGDFESFQMLNRSKWRLRKAAIQTADYKATKQFNDGRWLSDWSCVKWAGTYNTPEPSASSFHSHSLNIVIEEEYWEMYARKSAKEGDEVGRALKFDKPTHC